MSAPELAALLRKLPLKAALLTDSVGAIVLRAGELGDNTELELQRMGTTFAHTAEQAGKAGLGKNMHTTAFYDEATVVHVSVSPLVLTLLAESEANVGLLLDAVPQLTAAVEPLQAAMAGRPTS